MEALRSNNSLVSYAIIPSVGTAQNDTAPATHAFGLNLVSLPTGLVTRN